MSLTYAPAFSDYFPHTRRGHGTTHPQDRVKKIDGRFVVVRKGNPCVDQTCGLYHTNSKNLHTDQKTNRKDWDKERGLDRK